MKCKYCEYEAPIILGLNDDIRKIEEFINVKEHKDNNGNGWLEAILKCPKCGREQ